MKRTTILADEAVMTELEYLARADGVPTSRLIREALERYVSERARQRDSRLPAFVGIGASGDPSLAARDEEILASELPKAVWDDVASLQRRPRRGVARSRG